MTTIRIKIALAFVFVSMIGAVLSAFFIHQRTQLAFDRFIINQINQDQSDLVIALTQHYQDTGSWSGVDNVFIQLPRWSEVDPEKNPAPPPEKANDEHGWLPFILVDADGVMVYGRNPRPDQPVSTIEFENKLPLEVEGQTVGWLMESPLPRPWDPNTPQGTFLESIKRDIYLSAVGALVLALLLGGLLARSLTRPLRELAEATEVVAQGELGYQVEVRSKDELGQLASSFNKMSVDLAKSNQARKQMTADIAHDLRNPLSIILGYTEALSDGKLSGSADVFTTMHKEAQHLGLLIDDLRTLSLLDSEELSLTYQQIAPKTLLERISAAHSPQAQNKAISIRVNVDQDLPVVEVDPERMAQVLGNLVSNAMRYVPEGGWIELSATADDSSVTLHVRDNGLGIAPEDLPHVFTRFYRGDKSRQLNGEAGLGLTIARSLVEAHGGRISVESEPGQGTTFTIRLPRPA